MTKDDWTTIGRIPRNSTDEWMIKTGRYWNIDVVDIRLHSNDNPTKKGVRLNFDEIKLLKQILDKVNTNENSRSEKNIED
jgi:hypothetical protein